jgi:enoyl-[acyl-carrier protein] reductase I
MLLSEKKLLITGVLTDSSIAFDVAKVAQEQGAEIVLTGFGRGMSLTQRVAKRLPKLPEVLELDVNEPAHVERLATTLKGSWGRVDGVLHAIAFAPEDALGGNFLNTPWDSVRTAFQTSAYSLKALAVGLLPLMQERGGSIVSLDFDARFAWPIYDWMGVSKAALEAVTRYLARDLGKHKIRVNTVAAGPLRTMAAKSIPGFKRLTDVWTKRAPLGWDIGDTRPVADAVAFFFSDLSKATTGHIFYVDGGVHAMGTELGDTEPPPA